MFGSERLRQFKPNVEASLIQLLRNEGVLFLGKTHVNEFGLASTLKTL